MIFSITLLIQKIQLLKRVEFIAVLIKNADIDECSFAKRGFDTIT